MKNEWRGLVCAYIAKAAKPPEKFGHQVRLYELTLEIGRDLLYDDDVVYAAAYLHDIGVFKGHRPESIDLLVNWDNVAYACKRAPALLRKFQFPGDIKAVVEAIRTHQAKAEPRSLEAVIVRDADILEQLGAVGILRTVCKIGRDTRYWSFTDARQVLWEAARELPEKLRLPRSQELAVARLANMKAFLEAVDDEAGVSLF